MERAKYKATQGDKVFFGTTSEIAAHFGWTLRTTRFYITQGYAGNGVKIKLVNTERQLNSNDKTYLDKFDKEWRAMQALFGKG